MWQRLISTASHQKEQCSHTRELPAPHDSRRTARHAIHLHGTRLRSPYVSLTNMIICFTFRFCICRYVASPLCAPSRAALALGREYETQQVPGNSYDVPDGLITHYRALRDTGGYHVMVSGKDDLTKHSGYGQDGSYRECECSGFCTRILHRSRSARVFAQM